MRWAFTRFYREFAWSYDAVAWLVSRGLWRSWTLCALPYLSGPLLELGCGTGYLQVELARRGYSFSAAIDLSPQMLALTRRSARRKGVTLCLARAAAQHLPFSTGLFTTILATFPAEYILAPQTAAEIRRTLTHSGRIVFVDAAHFTHEGLYERLVDLAFRVTLQHSTRPTALDDLITEQYIERLEHFRQVGFTFAVHWEQVGSSRVAVLVGTLPDKQSPDG